MIEEGETSVGGGLIVLLYLAMCIAVLYIIYNIYIYICERMESTLLDEMEL